MRLSGLKRSRLSGRSKIAALIAVLLAVAYLGESGVGDDDVMRITSRSSLLQPQVSTTSAPATASQIPATFIPPPPTPPPATPTPVPPTQHHRQQHPRPFPQHRHHRQQHPRRYHPPLSPRTATPIPTQTPQQAPVAAADCTPGYSPCIPNGSDVDCRGGSGDGPRYVGRVTVTGSDPYDLDRDGDGVGCQ